MRIGSALLVGLIATRIALAQEPDAQPAAHLTGNRFMQRDKLSDEGISFDLTLAIDGTKNLNGGIDTEGETWRRLLDMAITLDTKKLFNIEGGTAFMDLQYAQGPNASDELVGDIQGIDGLDGVPGAPHQNRTQVAQLWYEQRAFDGMLRIKAGKVDANTEFDHCNSAQEFLHQSMGSSATLFTLPTYPDPAMGINVFFKPTTDIQIGIGVYDGAYANGVRTGSYGPASVWHDNDLFLIGEIDKSWTVGLNGLPGRIGAGGWYSTNTFPRQDGGDASGTGGPYAWLEQALWRPDQNGDRGIWIFVMYGYGDPAILPYDHNIGGGVSWTGPIEQRPDDVAGIGLQSIHFSDAFHATDTLETSYEMFYRVQLTPWFSIKPDVQYVINPGGQGTRDALAVTVRFQVDF